ncbi:MAG: YdcF family protein [Proteobacteria bacterium]|nr:YdcF family protein [Luminiphilus sp.]MBL6820873.1 YdcF family protein [Luminiphilus sp.]MDA0650770.1 YdcF family protein [Pseudomonadota bacterium]
MLLLSKITSLLLYPLSFSLFLLLLAFLLRLRGARARSASLTLIGALWLYVCSTEFGASALSRPLESAYPAFANEELPAAQAIVILGGATAESRYGLGGDLNHAADRLWRGAALYYAEKAPLIVLTGGTLTGGRPEALLMAQKLREIGIPDTAMLREAESRTTRENAQFTRTLLQARGISHILLVTSATHMRRSIALFSAQGFSVTAVATDHQIPLTAGPVPGWLPTADRLARSSRAIHEWAGYQVYSWLGYFSPDESAAEA